MVNTEIYKIKIDNTNNILYGDGQTKFSIAMPTYIQEKLYNKKFLWYVETAQLKAVLAGGDVGTDNLAIASNLQQINSYSNTNNNYSRVLCYFPSQRKDIVATTSAILSLDYPSAPQVARDLPPVLEFEIVESYGETQVALQPADLWFLILHLQVLEEE